MIEIVIDKDLQNQRLDKLIKKRLRKAPLALIYKLLRKNNIKLNNKPATGSEILVAGDIVKFFISDAMLTELTEERVQKNDVIKKPAGQSFTIVYEDENVLLVNKPAGLLEETLNDEVVYYLTKGQRGLFVPGLANRLDRNTSGIILVGKNLPAAQELSRALAERSLQKYYITLVNGKLTGRGILQGYLTKNEKTNEVSVSDKPSKGCKECMTGYREIKRTDGINFVSENYSLLEIQLLTGRSHQIRAHLKYINHSIVGDRKYGDEKVNKQFSQKFGLEDQFLHAAKITFGTLGERLSYLNGKSFSAPLPDQFKKVLRGVI